MERHCQVGESYFKVLKFQFEKFFAKYATKNTDALMWVGKYGPPNTILYPI